MNGSDAKLEELRQWHCPEPDGTCRSCRGEVFPCITARVIEGEADLRVYYVGWGGRQRHLPARMGLGRSAHPLHDEQHRRPRCGLRGAAFDAAFGYVNGFPLSAIAYFVLTRSLSLRVRRRVIAWEGKSGRRGS